MADVLGLPLDQTNILDAPASMLIGGEAGAGKTFALVTALPADRTLWICSSAKVLQAPAQLEWANPELFRAAGMALPTARIVIPATVPGAPDTRLPNRTAIHDILVKLAAAAQKGQRPYRNLVFANWDTFLARVFEEFTAEVRALRVSGGKAGQLDHVIKTKEWAVWVYDVCRANGFNGFFEVNERSPKFDADEDSPTRGQMLSRRGPNMPIYTMIEQCVNDADAYIRLTASLLGRRWQTKPTADTWAKLRGFSEPPFVTIPPGPNGKPRTAEDPTLPELLALAGYRL